MQLLGLDLETNMIMHREIRNNFGRTLEIKKNPNRMMRPEKYKEVLKLNRSVYHKNSIAAAAAKSLQSCPTLCDPKDGSPPGSSAPGILQARTLEWVAISFSNACMHAKSFSRVHFCVTPWTAAHQAPLSPGFSRQEYWSGLPFPSPRIAQQCSLHMLAKKCSKSFKLGFNNTRTENFPVYKLDLEKAEEPEIKLPTSAGT